MEQQNLLLLPSDNDDDTPSASADITLRGEIILVPRIIHFWRTVAA